MFIQTDKNSQYLYDIVKPNDCYHKARQADKQQGIAYAKQKRENI